MSGLSVMGPGSGNNCAATVSIDNYLNVPVINFNNASFKVTLVLYSYFGRDSLV